ncbi:hypothetical protein I316_01938 [Kwoniella heveanensis BCC8398]|uniref:BRCT domain-containing protein n=1 Tax=Kwoniella heveanensis BCC8398 TaxID=1296120 RepID=A0A1B9GYH3_9TREE|nr:hypothetical protein I316_01938 [Kwoniella heveanensis BCC8398]
MTPPRRRQPSTSTSTSTTLGSQVQSIRTLSRPRPASSSTGAPRTRSMARTTKLQVYDENANTPAASGGSSGSGGGIKSTLSVGSGSGRSLRSRGPLKENVSMNVLEARKMDPNGKRKAADLSGDDGGDAKKAAKVMKVDQTGAVAPSRALGISKNNGTKSIRSLGHKSSGDSLRSVQPSVPSTPIHSTNISSVPIQQPIPTPARELLRNPTDCSTSPTDSPPTKFVARPPTPPRMRERPMLQEKESSSTPSVPFMTPRKTPFGSLQDPPRTEGRLSKMPASLRKTPGQTSVAPSTPRQFTVPTMPQSLKSATRDINSTLAPTLTPRLAPSARHLATGMAPTSSDIFTTPTISPPPVNTVPIIQPAPPVSPVAARRATFPKVGNTSQSTLDSVFPRSPKKSPAQPMQPESVVKSASVVMSSTSSDDLDQGLAIPEGAAILTSGKDGVAPGDQAADTSHEVLTPSFSSQAPASLIPLNSSGTTALGVMAPPSRIPRSVAATASSSAKIVKKASSTVTKKPSFQSVGSLPERRPSTRPALVSACSSNAVRGPAPAAALPSPVKRKPSYPSSLGSGPLARPTPRMVSNPLLPPRSLSDSSTGLTDDLESTSTTQPRSVSAPGPRESAGSQLRSSLSSSTREGLSGETSRSLVDLSEALGKLKMKRPENGSTSTQSRSHSTAATPSIKINGFRVFEEKPANLTGSTSSAGPDAGPSSRLSSANHRPRASVSVHPGDLSTSSDEGAADQSIAAMLCSTIGGGCLKGVRAFVDVRTSDGEDSGKLFVEILKGLGARVQSRPSERCTHVIYKSGKTSTLAWWRKQEDPKPLIVGIKWVTECKKAGKRVEENDFVVDVSKEDVFQKQRKSMEPKAIAAIQGLAPPPNPMRQALLDIAQARQKSMKYAPKISSPLKTGFLRPFDEE